MAAPCSSITLTRKWLSTCLFEEPWPTYETSTTNQFLLLRPPMTSFFHLQKFSIEILVSIRTEIIFWWKVWWFGSLYLPDGSFPVIPTNVSWNIRIESARIRLNFVLCASCVLWTNMDSKEKMHKIRFGFYIFKGWRDTPINLIWLI